MSLHQQRNELLKVYSAALNAVDGRNAVRRHLQSQPLSGPCTLIAIGKAAEAMTLGACDALGDRVSGGLVISKPGHLDFPRLRALGLDVVEGGHPLPTQGSLDAGRRLLELLRGKTEGKLLFLISGGASSLVESPVAGLSLAELERAGNWLLGSGLSIDAMNLVRKSLSHIKGGGLLTALGERQVTALAVSDVPGDDVSVIGSGLLVPDSGLADKVRRLELPEWLRGWVEQGLAERGGLLIKGPEVTIVASLSQAMDAAEQEARRLGYAACVHKTFIEGDAGLAGERLARHLLSASVGIHIWGGESTVRLPENPGRGGRNQHLALSAARKIGGHGDCLFMSAGTDGSDGPTEDAGALVDGGTLERALAQGLDPIQSLERADAGTLLEATGDLIRTGPTGTNVMDLMLGFKLEAAKV